MIELRNWRKNKMQNWKKLFNRINWINRPSTATPIDQNNLNKSDSALDGIDDRVITLDTIKADISEVNEMVSSVTLNESTGVLTINYKNGSSQTYNTNLQKIAVNFSYDSVNQRLVITLEDGTYQYVDMSALVTQYEFKESSTITFSVAEDGSISASVKNGSITESMLETGYLANIKVETGKAKSYADNAKESETQSEYYSKMSMSYANGLSGLREGEAVDNAKYYMEQAKSAAGMSIATTTVPGKVMATDDVKVSSTGAMSVGTDFVVPEALSSLVSGSEWSEFKGKIAKMIDDYIYEKVNGYSTAGDLVAKSGTSSPVSLSGLKDDIGSTDISTVGDGTITGAISTLNSNLTFEYTSVPPNRQELPSAYPMQLKKYGRIVTATVTLLPATDISYATDQIPLFVLPEKYRPVDGLSAPIPNVNGLSPIVFLIRKDGYVYLQNISSPIKSGCYTIFRGCWISKT